MNNPRAASSSTIAAALFLLATFMPAVGARNLASQRTGELAASESAQREASTSESAAQPRPVAETSPAAPSKADPKRQSPTKAGPSPTKTEPKYDMTTYQFVLLKSGPNEEKLGEEMSARMQSEHLAGLEALVNRRLAILVGPLRDGKEIRGVVVLDVKTAEEARAVLADDPWLRSGHMVAEIHPWFAAKGILKAPRTFMDLETCFLGLLVRPPDAPQFSEEKLQEIQKGHMENINAMAASGDLVIAGPMKDDGALRGIFVFRTPSADRVRELVARDPAVKAGRLRMDLYSMMVSRGVLPLWSSAPGGS